MDFFASIFEEWLKKKLLDYKVEEMVEKKVRQEVLVLEQKLVLGLESELESRIMANLKQKNKKTEEKEDEVEGLSDLQKTILVFLLFPFSIAVSALLDKLIF